MVSFKFNTSKVANFITDVPSKHGFQLKDLNRICVYLHYYDKEQNPFYVGQGSIRRAFSFTSRNKLWKEKVIDITKVKVNIFKIDIAISVANIDRKPVNIKILYGAEDLRINGFTPKNVSQVITGAKKSHAGYIFLDFFKLHKEEKEKYINLIDITTKI